MDDGGSPVYTDISVNRTKIKCIIYLVSIYYDEVNHFIIYLRKILLIFRALDLVAIELNKLHIER